MKFTSHRRILSLPSFTNFKVWLCLIFCPFILLAQVDNSSIPPTQTASNSAQEETALEEAEDIRDIRDPVRIPYPWLPYAIAAGIIVGILALCYLFYQWFKRRDAKKAKETRLTPYDRALKDLKNTRPLMENGQDKAFSIAVSDVLRHYLEGQFAMPAPERTTEEFLTEISGHILIKDSLADHLTGFLQDCDLVKFARQPLGLGQMKGLYEKAENFIEESYVKTHMRAAMLGQEAHNINSDSPSIANSPS